jgi:hypothetical protein
MRRLSTKHQTELNELTPILKRMKPSRASELSNLLYDCERAADKAKDLLNVIEEICLEPSYRALYTEGMDPADAKTLDDYLCSINDELESVHTHPEVESLSSKEDLFSNLSTVAVDVWNDAPQEEEKEIVAKE